MICFPGDLHHALLGGLFPELSEELLARKIIYCYSKD